MINKYELDVDNFCEEVFYFLEGISRGIEGHKCVVHALDEEGAAKIISAALCDFIEPRLNKINDNEAQ